MLRYEIIYIYGLDGSGKSTVCQALFKELEKRETQAIYRWMRFNHYSSKLINGIGRLVGLSYYITYPDGTRIGYHRYNKSRLLGLFYSLSIIMDTFMATLFKIWIPNIFRHQVIVLDRFVFDKIVDLSIDMRDPKLMLKLPGRLLKRLLPRKAFSIHLRVDNDRIFERRPDVRWDESYLVRAALYEEICKIYGENRKVDNNGELKDTLDAIMKQLSK